MCSIRRLLALAGVAAAAAIPGCAVNPIQSALHPAGPAASRIAWLWWALLAFSALVFLAVFALLVIAVVRRPTDPRFTLSPGSTRFVVIGGIAVPALFLVGTVIASLQTTVALKMPPPPMTIDVTGHQWWWEVRYLDQGISIANEIYIPAGRPVRLRLRSADVIHSFWAPSLNGKMDLISGKVDNFWGDARYGTIWNCPDDHLTRDDCSGGPGKAIGYVTSYAIPIYHPDFPTTRFGVIARCAAGDKFDRNGAFVNSKTLSEIGRPADTIVLYEFYGADAGYSRFTVSMRSNNANIADPAWTDFPKTIGIGDLCGDGFNWQYTMGSHNGVMNMGFMDGHAKNMNRKRTMNVVGGNWNGQAPNMLHFDERFHLN